MKKRLLHISFNTENEEELLSFYEQAIKEKKKVFTLTPNLDHLRVSYKDKVFKDVINKADVSTVDGVPILWIAKWLKIKEIKNKISGSDLSIKMLELLNKIGGSLFLFGGKDGVAELAKDKISKDYPNIIVKGLLTPVFSYETNDDLCSEYIKTINDSKSDVVFLCTGAPKTEKFFAKYYDKFDNSCYFSVGATIDFIAGNIKRAPQWMSKFGLEWLYRLTKDFKRLFKRYWLDGWFLIKIWFICHFKKKKVKQLMDE